MLSFLKSKIYSSTNFENLLKSVKNTGVLYLDNINGSLVDFSISYLLENNYKIIVITPDRKSAEFLLDDLSLIYQGNIDYFPPYGGLFTEVDRQNIYDKILRLKTLINLINNDSNIVLTTGKALIHPLIPSQFLKDAVSKVKVNYQMNFEDFILYLSDTGFKREDFVAEAGDFSVRGGIIDIFSLIYPNPVRIEFFGNTIESIRFFDINSQRSSKNINSATIVPPLNDIKESGNNLFGYLQSDFIPFFIDDCLIKKNIQDYFERWNSTKYKYKTNEERDLFKSLDGFFDFNDLYSNLKSRKLITTGLSALPKKQRVNFNSKPSLVFNRSIKSLIKNIISDKTANNHLHTYILCDNKGQKERLDTVLEEEPEIDGKWNTEVLPIKKGFIYPEGNIALYTDYEIFERKFYRRSSFVPKSRAEFAVKLNKLSLGDYVVHEDHGIGKFVGLQKIFVGGSEQECLKIKYRDNDVLYLNVDKLNFLQKYTGQEGFKPQLSKLGTGEWNKLKEKTRKSIENIAKDLILLYSQRKNRKGHSFSADTLWQQEVEASFLYEETDDQLKSTEEVKKDMESSLPMDRLLCGDVGFGKTEVAVRAAFKAVNDGRQAAILVPTTILAEQHYNTFKDRLGSYPVDIEVLSRFKTKNEQKKIVENIKKGKIDIIIGTHRLLSKDLKFKNLGLLIVDEEQRFGVKHKEKLKMMKKEIDVLTMTATPIPRTLQFSLMGVRDLSEINTPPKNRLPIITEIIKFDDSFIRDAIYREIDRGGQIYFVHNRVQTIDRIADKLRNIVPGVKFEVAHGQMKEKKLENVMLKFLKKGFDVLVCTMIIEAGLDIPNVNTIIINRADKFGVAQLYQLRGRVGRSDIQAYAYLVIPGWKYLTCEAVKRLRTLAQHTELGSGFQIAMNDLEIRGAGNIFGAEQSGFINSIGYEMYNKILEQAVKELKSDIMPDIFEKEKHYKPNDAKIDINQDAYFPEHFIENKEERVNLYKRLASAEELSEISEIRDEIVDRFGKIPAEGKTLLDIAEIRQAAIKLGISKIKFDEDVVTIKFIFDKNDRLKDKHYLEKIVSEFADFCKYPFTFTQNKGLGIRIELSNGTNSDNICVIKSLLIDLYTEVKNEKIVAG